MKSAKIILYSSFLFLLSCAQIVPLTGGDQDITPPKEVESFPKNGATHFTEKKVVVEFDEFIKLQNLNSQLIISPPLENKPEVMVRGKKLIIKLADTLAPNTTYSFNFGNAITDITEFNPYPNYKYVFSTGDYIDSLSYSGTVINAFDLSAKEKCLVLLYNQYEDSVPMLELPRYIAISDKEGNFEVTNIAPGRYKVFAIEDINNNYLYDLPNEIIGFKNTPIELTSNSPDNMLYLFEEDNKIQYVVKSEMAGFGHVKVILNKPADSLHFSSVEYPSNRSLFLQELNATKDTISLFGVYQDELAFPLTRVEQVKDWATIGIMDGNEFTDTLNLKPITKFTDSLCKVSFNNNGTLDLNKNLIIATNRPLKNFDAAKILLYQDSILVAPQPKITQIGLRKLELDFGYQESHQYELKVLPEALEDVFDLVNDTIELGFVTKKLSDYGNIKLVLTPNFTENYILQLWKGKILVQEDSFSGIINHQYSYLNPGNYELKLIIDSDNDGRWSTGNYLGKRQPEKVIFYEKDIAIRANWDNDISWVIKD